MIFVVDLERMRSFYESAFDFRVDPAKSSEGWVELDAGGVTLGLHAIPKAIADTISISDPPERREENAIKLIFEVSNLVAQRAKLIALGAQMSEPSAWGSCDGVDLEGNVFQILERRL